MINRALPLLTVILMSILFGIELGNWILSEAPGRTAVYAFAAMFFSLAWLIQLSRNDEV